MSANWIGYALLGILLISSVLIYKPFCRTLCPVGLILGWVSFIPGARRLNKNELCVNCKNCNDECNQRAMIHEDRKTVLHNEDCIMCGECFDGCKKKALKINNHKSGTKILSVHCIGTDDFINSKCSMGMSQQIGR
jgi:Polyferredoxin